MGGGGEGGQGEDTSVRGFPPVKERVRGQGGISSPASPASPASPLP